MRGFAKRKRPHDDVAAFEMLKERIGATDDLAERCNLLGGFHLSLSILRRAPPCSMERTCHTANTKASGK